MADDFKEIPNNDSSNLNNPQDVNFNDIQDEDFFDAIVNFDWTTEQNTDFLADGSCCAGRFGK